MTVKCPKCGGYIPDISYGSRIDVCDCKNHIKPDMTFKQAFKRIHFDQDGKRID